MRDVLITVTSRDHGRGRLDLAFAIGRSVASGGARVVVFLAADSVTSAAIELVDTSPVASAYLAHGGEIWVNDASLREHDVAPSQLADGVAVVTTTAVAQRVLAGATTLTI